VFTVDLEPKADRGSPNYRPNAKGTSIDRKCNQTAK